MGTSDDELQKVLINYLVIFWSVISIRCTSYFYFTLIKYSTVRPIASLKFIVGVQVAKCYLRRFSLELVYFGKK